MKLITLKILPSFLIEWILRYRSSREWKKRNFLNNSPQFVKEAIFKKYGLTDTKWVETGTYLGTTTNYLRKNYPHVFSIEPSKELYNFAKKRFKNKNVTLYNDVSENVMPLLLPSLSGNLNFWLDGHFSDGITFRGKKDCPVEDELLTIEENLERFEKLTILIDDVRCFLPDYSENSDYPSIDYLVDWTRKHNMNWRIEHDIFIIQKL